MLVVLAFVSACGPKTSGGTASRTVAQSAAKPGWKEIKSSGIAISAPPDWNPLDLSAKDLDTLIASSIEANPGIKSSEAMIRGAAASGAIKIIAFGPTAGTFTPNFNVVVMEGPTTPTADELKTMYEREIKPLLVPGASPEAESVQLPAGKAYRMLSRLAMAQEVASIAYVFGHDRKAYTITFSDLPENLEKSKALAAQVMETIRVE